MNLQIALETLVDRLHDIRLQDASRTDPLPFGVQPVARVGADRFPARRPGVLMCSPSAPRHRGVADPHPDPTNPNPMEKEARVFLELSSDQEFFRETTARFLDEQAAGRRAAAPARRSGRLRPPTTGGAAPSSAGPRCWSTRATAAARSRGAGLVDLTPRRVRVRPPRRPGPLVPTNVVAGALSVGRRRPPRRSSPACSPARSIATWCLGEPAPRRRPRRRAPRDPRRRRRARARRA